MNKAVLAKKMPKMGAEHEPFKAHKVKAAIGKKKYGTRRKRA